MLRLLLLLDPPQGRETSRKRMKHGPVIPVRIQCEFIPGTLQGPLPQKLAKDA